MNRQQRIRQTLIEEIDLWDENSEVEMAHLDQIVQALDALMREEVSKLLELHMKYCELQSGVEQLNKGKDE